jgi:cytochrome c biogenesis protein CcdA
MLTLIPSLIAIAALDSLNPTAVALQIYILSGTRPIGKSLAFIFGVFFAYWSGGVLLVLGVSQITATFLHHVNFSIAEDYLYTVQFLVGIILFACGLGLQISPEDDTKPRLQHLTVTRTFLLGLGVTISELPTALPYVAAIERLSHAKLNLFSITSILGLYNIIFVFPLFLLILLYVTFQQESAAILQRINRSISFWSSKILRWLLLGLGILLIIDVMSYGFGYPLLKSF